MFRKDQINQILEEKNSAFKVLIATQEKLRKTCEKAFKFIAINDDKVKLKFIEINDLKGTNDSLSTYVKSMESSIEQAESIINPLPLAKTEEDGI